MQLRPWIGLAAFALIAGPWLVFAAKDGWLSEHVRAHIIGRITSEGTTGHRHSFFFYLKAFPAAFTPWTLLLIPVARFFPRGA